jgi:hypothetical protein
MILEFVAIAAAIGAEHGSREDDLFPHQNREPLSGSWAKP